MDPVFSKMNVKDLKSLTIINHPKSFSSHIETLEKQSDIKVSKEYNSNSKIDWFLCFVTEKIQINESIKSVGPLLSDDALLWFAYPKKSSKNYQSDISRDAGWTALGNLGWEGVRQISIDNDWSALRFRRVKHIKTITRRASMAMTEEAKVRTSNKD